MTKLGLPCLLPVRVQVEGAEAARGFVTRLGGRTACVSCQPELLPGTKVTITIRRPSDDERLTLTGEVEMLLDEGGLWRGRSAALVRLVDPAPDDFLGVPAAEGGAQDEQPLRRGAEPTAQTAYVPGRIGGRPLRSGLGRRRRSSRHRPSSRPSALPKTTAPPHASPQGDAPLRLEPNARGGAPQTVPRSQAFESAALAAPDATGLDELVGEGLDSAVLNPPDPGVSEAGIGGGGLSVLESEADDAPLAIPEGPLVLDTPAPGHEPSLESIEGLESLDLDASLVMPLTEDDSADIPPIPDDSADFWDDASWASDDSLSSVADAMIPRAARIPSGIPVHFWSQGQRLSATALNFSREGMYLTFDSQPPSRGATVRVEFALGDQLPEAAIRFSAEVRWHGADRPSGELPDGFGVHILEFETSEDDKRYAKLLVYLLAIETPKRERSASTQ